MQLYLDGVAFSLGLGAGLLGFLALGDFEVHLLVGLAQLSGALINAAFEFFG